MMPAHISNRTAARATATRFTAIRFTAAAAAVAVTFALTGCQTSGASADGDAKDASNAVTLVVHDSFPNEAFAEAASKATGLDVTVLTAGDGGELTNKLVLTKGAPIADAFYGVDNALASRLVDHDVVEPYATALPEGADAFAYDKLGSVLPVDHGATCVNIDPGWFTEQGIAAPETYEDLVKPEYRDLTVLLDPTSSSTGASFLVGTVAHFGEDGFANYWTELLGNGAKLVQGWTEGYNGEFTQGGESGTRPIVVSYSTSPAWTVTEDGSSSTTANLPATCSTQIEYAGVLRGAQNPDGARAVVDYLLSSEFQSTIADTMYMYPVDAAVELPAEWLQFASLPAELNDLPAATIGAERESWLRAWSEATGY